MASAIEQPDSVLTAVQEQLKAIDDVRSHKADAINALLSECGLTRENAMVDIVPMIRSAKTEEQRNLLLRLQGFLCTSHAQEMRDQFKKLGKPNVLLSDLDRFAAMLVRGDVSSSTHGNYFSEVAKQHRLLFNDQVVTGLATEILTVSNPADILAFSVERMKKLFEFPFVDSRKYKLFSITCKSNPDGDVRALVVARNPMNDSFITCVINSAVDTHGYFIIEGKRQSASGPLEEHIFTDVKTTFMTCSNDTSKVVRLIPCSCDNCVSSLATVISVV